MGFLTAALTTAAVASSVSSAVGQRRAANAATDQAAQAAADARARGEEAVQSYNADLAQLLGRQRAVMAASGVDVGQGSAAEVRRETEANAAIDVNRIRENARREALGLRMQGETMARGLRAGANTAMANAGMTLLTAGVDAWTQYSAGRSAMVAGQARAAAPATSAALTRSRGSLDLGAVGRSSGWGR